MTNSNGPRWRLLRLPGTPLRRRLLILLILIFLLLVVGSRQESVHKATLSLPVHISTPLKELYSTPHWRSYAALGLAPPTSRFPENEFITLTTAAHVKNRAAAVQRLFSCYGKKEGEGTHNETSDLYDFVVLPIGCFGDTLDACTSCTLSKTLVNATYCGRQKIGLFLGDNFYPYGIRSRRDRRFRRELRYKFYRFPELQMTYYATSGNHDGWPKYLYRTEKYWMMPAPFYRSGIQQSGETTVEIFTISTNPYDMIGRKHFFEYQKAWLNSSLANSTAQWKIVMTHEPIINVISLQYHAQGLKYIHPLLKQHGVQILVCAHLHGVFLHRVDGAYYQLTSAGFANNLVGSVNIHRPLGYNHLGVAATALLVKQETITVVSADADGYLVFHHIVPRHMAS
ncbi:acid phosphatase [Trypanosoma grayi]|uniref:acid phosphatase n=1 Tax=Trypanosoma grayi TaxID=71804 RepID=UPI0004F49884|nr:acid phosphatase [Trypanosoma grayi]KEG08716.1 acid phosphatase [Trypanosoma grayi]